MRWSPTPCHACQACRTLAANIRADAEGRYADSEPRWQAGVEWTLLWIENTAGQLTEGKP
ncbi:hypothetical protein GCM10010207_88320 [Streptomyces atratus]|uniref:hypothetical protein n=1 Tax=Streptomyces atratus TaxID=1893 RepID=UPI00167172FB|nr:hypothetical protein [Streptomyces atratus]GGT79024.1 hypothetical protein GCM10010207_88320 [Streptomyces atratus]